MAYTLALIHVIKHCRSYVKALHVRIRSVLDTCEKKIESQAGDTIVDLIVISDFAFGGT